MTDELRQMVARIVGDIVDTDTSKEAGEPATNTERVDEPRSLRAEAEQRSLGDRDQAANPKRPPFFVDRCYYLLSSVSIFLGKAQPLSKLVGDGFVP